MLGGLLAGGCVILHGTNENLGWAHTVNYPDKIDVFQLQMNPDNSNQYKFDDQWIDLEDQKAKLKVKGIPVTINKNIYWSKYGATVKTKKGVFAIRLPATDGYKGHGRMVPDEQGKKFYRVLPGAKHDEPAHVQYHVC